MATWSQETMPPQMERTMMPEERSWNMMQHSRPFTGDDRVMAPMPDALSGRGSSQQAYMGRRPAPDRLSTDMSNHLPDQVVEDPQSASQDYIGSLKAMLRQNKGNYLVATFLVGTQNTVSWEGILYEVGNDYMTIYQPGRDRYIVSDIYSLKYMEFYDMQRRERCNQLLAEEEYPR